MYFKRILVIALVGVALFASGAAAQRGSDGQLKIIYWQAPSLLNPYLSGGTKDIEASSLILEPLANFDEQGNMVPVLAESIPTASADLKSITWKLKPGVVWSDGTPVTADDVIFTGEYCMHKDSGCASSSHFTDVASIEKLDDRTVKINFSVSKPFPYGPFVSAKAPILQKAQFKDCLGAKAPECTKENFGPIGTGPFKVTEFRANDVSTYVANDKYRDPDKPKFASIILKGGGDSASAARSVLETGEFDYAWNLQIEPEVMSQMEAAGKGKVVVAFGTSVERLMVNLTNPSSKLSPDVRSTLKAGPNPFVGEEAVRRALSLAIDRQILVDAGYGSNGRVTCNVLPAPAIYASTANDWCKVQDIQKANQLLDKAGWKRGSDGVRVKNGVRLSILYQTSTNSVRQATQALIKQMWQQIGVETELKNISGSIFFGGDPASPDTYQKFYADVEMYTNNFQGTDPETYMAQWSCDEIPNPENQWQGSNIPRYCTKEYDQLVVKMANTSALKERAALAKKMNDMLMEYGAIIPLVHRGRVSAHSLKLGGVQHNAWDSELWNTEDWHRLK